MKRSTNLPIKLVLACCSVLTTTLYSTANLAHTSPPEEKRHIIAPQPTSAPKIQLAILLDTSGSMDGLIDQTRNQLWQVVNELSMAKRNGITPT